MERAQVLVIIAVVAAVGLFSLRFLSGPTEPGEVSGFRRDEHRSSAGQTVDVHDSAGDRAGSLKGEGGRERSAAVDPNRHSDSSGFPTTRSGGVPQVLSVGKGSRGGEVGVSVTARSGGGSGSGVSGGSDVLPYRRVESNPKRSEVVELLASRAASGKGTASFDDDTGADGEVALEVKTPEDAKPAIVKKEIDAPETSEDGLTFTDSSVLAFPNAGNASGDAGTISFEIEPKWAGAEDTNNSFVQIRGANQWADRLQLVKNGQYLRFIVADTEGREADISVKIDQWPPGETHQIRASWGEGITTLWVDGRQVGSNTYSGNLRFPSGTPLYLGSDHPGSSYGGMNATLRGFKVTTTASHNESG